MQKSKGTLDGKEMFSHYVQRLPKSKTNSFFNQGHWPRLKAQRAASNSCSVAFHSRAAGADALTPNILPQHPVSVSWEQLLALKTQQFCEDNKPQPSAIQTSQCLCFSCRKLSSCASELEESLGEGASVNWAVSNLSPAQGSRAVSSSLSAVFGHHLSALGRLG